MTVTLTAREREVFASMIEYVLERCANQHGFKISGHAVARWMEDWLASQPAETSASPPRVEYVSKDEASALHDAMKASSALVHGGEIERGPGQPMTDICERLDAEAMRLEHKGRLVDEFPSAIMREAAAEIRRLRDQVYCADAKSSLDIGEQRQAAREAGRDEGFRAGIEAAAKWHDKEAIILATMGESEMADRHEYHAATIRALAASPYAKKTKDD